MGFIFLWVLYFYGFYIFMGFILHYQIIDFSKGTDINNACATT